MSRANPSRTASAAYGTGGFYTETYNSNVGGNGKVTLSRQSDGTWSASGSYKGNSGLQDNFTDTYLLTTTSSGPTGTSTSTSSYNAGQTVSYNKSAKYTLANSVWDTGTGSGSGSGNYWNNTTTSGSGTTISSFASGLGKYNGSYSGSSTNNLTQGYKETFSLVGGNWMSQRSGSGTGSITNSGKNSGSGSYSLSGTTLRKLATTPGNDSKLNQKSQATRIPIPLIQTVGVPGWARFSNT